MAETKQKSMVWSALFIGLKLLLICAIVAGVIAGVNKFTDEKYQENMRVQKEQGRLLCAICAAPIVLIDAGVADSNLHMTCYPSMMMDLDRPYTNVPVVADGDLITGQGPGSATLFALVVLKALVGGAVATKIARNMVTDVLDE